MFYSNTIQRGSSGSDAKKWQEFLNTQGYKLDVDGIFGTKTYEATVDWQGKQGLDADGIVGQNTWGKAGYSNINKPVSAPTIAPTPTTPTYDTTSWDDTTKGQAASGAYKDAKDAVTGYKDFTFSEQEWLNKVKENIGNYGKFSYNFNEDALYQQAVERYRQMGNMAMQDTMGQAAALTGGYGNSYAASAGQQAYQSYLQEAHNMLPEYYQMALDRYNMGKEDLYNQYGMLMNEYEREYGLHSDEYNKLLDALGIAKDDYYSGADMFYTEQNNANNIAGKEFSDAMAIWEADTSEAWKEADWNESARRYALANSNTYSDDYGSSGGSGNSGSGSGGDSGNSGGNPITDDDDDETVNDKKTIKDFNNVAYLKNVKEKGGSYYKTVEADLWSMARNGKDKDSAISYLEEMIGNSYISASEYMTLMQWIRNNYDKEFSKNPAKVYKRGVTR